MNYTGKAFSSSPTEITEHSIPSSGRSLKNASGKLTEWKSDISNTVQQVESWSLLQPHPGPRLLPKCCGSFPQAKLYHHFSLFLVPIGSIFVSCLSGNSTLTLRFTAAPVNYSLWWIPLGLIPAAFASSGLSHLSFSDWTDSFCP